MWVPNIANGVSALFEKLYYILTSFDKFDKFIFIISKRSQTREENTCKMIIIIILYTL